MRELRKKYDKHNLFELLKSAPQHIEDVLKERLSIRKITNIEKIVIGGMGGSAISGIIAKSFMESFLNIPIIVLSQENVPFNCDKNTLFIGISYSGTTKETKSLLSQCKNAVVFGISTNNNFTTNTITIPEGLPPRYGFYYIFSTLIVLLSKIFGIRKPITYLKESVESLKKLEQSFAKKSGLPYEIALNIGKKPILIYGPSIFKGVVYRYKTQFNENAKHFAFSHYFPEMTHNEIVPYINIGQDFFILLLRSGYETNLEKQQMDFFKNYSDFEIEFSSKNIIDEILQFILLGDFTSYYLALLNGYDPYDIELINLLKSIINKK